MFYLALTAGEPTCPSGIPVVHAARIGGRHVLLATSARGGVTGEDGGFAYRVTSWSPDDPGYRDPLLTVSVSAAPPTFRLSRSTLCGFPVYFALTRGGDFFAATHLRLLREAGVPLVEDPSAVAEYFLYRFVMPPRTLCAGIQRLFLGGTLSATFDSAAVHIAGHVPAEWIETLPSALPAAPLAAHANHLFELLASDVRRLSPARGRVAALMSGGLDSTVVARLCEQAAEAATYSTGYPFETPGLDMEESYALSVARALGFRHRHYVSTAREFRAGLLRAVSDAEEPAAHLQTPCMHLLFRDGIDATYPVVAQGLGAGGLFGNFRNHLGLEFHPLLRHLPAGPLAALLAPLARATGRGGQLAARLRDRSSRVPLESVEHPLWRWQRVADVEWACRRFGTTPEAIVDPVRAVLERTAPPSPFDLWARYSLLGSEDAVLSHNAKVAAGCGRSLYSPMYVPAVLEYAAAIPWADKLRPPENGLRKALGRRAGLPGFALNRAKTGFGVKRRDWAVTGGPLSPLAVFAAGCFDEADIRAMQASALPAAMTFWNMVNYAIWHRLVIRRTPLEAMLAELAESEQRLGHND